MQFTQEQPRPQAGVLYHQRFTPCNRYEFGPMTTALILEHLKEEYRIKWMGLAQGRSDEMALYVSSCDEVVAEVKFPARRAYSGWLHVSCDNERMLKDVWEKAAAAIAQMIVPDDDPF